MSHPEIPDTLLDAELARCVTNEAECKRNWDALDHDAGAWQGVTDWLMEEAILWTDGPTWQQTSTENS